MPNTLFAVLMALIAAFGVYSMAKARSGRLRGGWILIAGGAALQAVNLLSAYSTALSIATTLAIVVGLWMSRGATSSPTA